MRLGLTVLALATGAAGAVLWLPELVTRDPFAVVTEVGEGGVARVAVPTKSEPSLPHGTNEPARFFGFALPRTGMPGEKPPSTVALGSTGDAPRDKTAPIVAPEPKLAVRPLPGPPQSQLVTVVAPAPSLAPPRERPRHELARDIQRELKRVGCYAGDVDGNWGPGSKRAAQTFMQHINSAVPTDEPDLVQLTLIRSFSGTTCAALCPPERMVPGSARCLPAPVMAARPPARLFEQRAIATQSTAPVVTGSMPSASVSAAPALPAGAATNPMPGPRMAAEAPISVVPLEGRMAVGAPPPPAGQLVAAPVGPGVTIAPPRRADRDERRVQRVSRLRRDRNWTATFFDR